MKTKELIEKLLDILKINDIDIAKLAIEKLIKDLNSGIAAPGRALSLIDISESEEEVIISAKLYNPKGWKFTDLVMKSERAKILREINQKRHEIFKSFFKISGAWKFKKTEKPNWKEKLENYIKADNKLCADLRKSLDGPDGPGPKPDAFTPNSKNKGFGR